MEATGAHISHGRQHGATHTCASVFRSLPKIPLSAFLLTYVGDAGAPARSVTIITTYHVRAWPPRRTYTAPSLRHRANPSGPLSHVNTTQPISAPIHIPYTALLHQAPPGGPHRRYAPVADVKVLEEASPVMPWNGRGGGSTKMDVTIN